MTHPQHPPARIPVFQLFGEHDGFPDILHCERIADRAPRHGWRIAPHRHARMHQFFLIEAGAAEVMTEGEPSRPALPAMVSVPAGGVHGFDFAPGTAGYVLSVPHSALPDAFAPGAPLAPFLARPLVYRSGAAERAAIEALFAAQAGDGPARSALLKALALQVAALAGAQAAETHGGVAEEDARLAAFDRLLRQHLRARWSVSDYASALGLSPAHLTRICRAVRGAPASRLIEAAVIREACRDLAYTRRSVSEIAYGLGFEDVSYFSRLFRRGTGLAPSAYRARSGSTLERIPADWEEPVLEASSESPNVVVSRLT